MNIRIFLEEKKDFNVATLLRDCSVNELSFNKGVLNINNGEESIEFKNVKSFIIEQ